MSPKSLMVRVFRALSGQTQREFAAATGVDVTLLARYELGAVEPGLDHLARLAEGAGLTVADGELILRYFDELREPRQRAGAGIEDLVDEVSDMLSRSYQRLLRLPLPVDPPRPEADGLFDPERMRDGDPPKR
jgi:transcriptional regulator with XRE-family HTH domain